MAQADLEAALDYFCSEAVHAAGEVIDALEQAAAHIQRHPGSGSASTRTNLIWRSCVIGRLHATPYALFCIEHDDHVHVVRVVHMSRDVPATLRAD